MAVIADVVVWKPKDELPFNELTEATNWVIGEAWKEVLAEEGAVDILQQEPDMLPVVVNFTPITIYDNSVRKRGKNYGYHSMQWFVIVVSDEPLDLQGATDIYNQYVAQLQQPEEVDDSGGRVRSDDGRDVHASEEQDSEGSGIHTEDEQASPIWLDPSMVPIVDDSDSGLPDRSGSMCTDSVSSSGATDNVG